MLVLVLIYLCSGITVVAPNERGLVLRFGRALPKSAPPGLLLAFPAPIDEVVMLPAKSVQEVVLDAWTPNEWSVPGFAPSGSRSLHHHRRCEHHPRALFRALSSGRPDRLRVRGQRSAKICAMPFSTNAPAAFSPGMSVDDVLTTRRDFIGQESMRLAQEELDRLGLGVQLLAFETREINPPAPVL